MAGRRGSGQPGPISGQCRAVAPTLPLAAGAVLSEPAHERVSGSSGQGVQSPTRSDSRIRGRGRPRSRAGRRGCIAPPVLTHPKMSGGSFSSVQHLLPAISKLDVGTRGNSSSGMLCIAASDRRFAVAGIADHRKRLATGVILASAGARISRYSGMPSTGPTSGRVRPAMKSRGRFASGKQRHLSCRLPHPEQTI